jgi:hypothetical protein
MILAISCFSPLCDHAISQVTNDVDAQDHCEGVQVDDTTGLTDVLFEGGNVEDCSHQDIPLLDPCTADDDDEGITVLFLPLCCVAWSVSLLDQSG